MQGREEYSTCFNLVAALTLQTFKVLNRLFSVKITIEEHEIFEASFFYYGGRYAFMSIQDFIFFTFLRFSQIGRERGEQRK